MTQKDANNIAHSLAVFRDRSLSAGTLDSLRFDALIFLLRMDCQIGCQDSSFDAVEFDNIIYAELCTDPEQGQRDD